MVDGATLNLSPGDPVFDLLLAVAKDRGLDTLDEALQLVVSEWVEMKAAQNGLLAAAMAVKLGEYGG